MTALDTSQILKHDERVKLTEEKGVRIATVRGPFGLYSCAYWQMREAPKGQDAWRYKLSVDFGEHGVGPYSHPNELGCEIAIRRHFIETGLIPMPDDNSHLDTRDAEIAKQIAANYKAKQSSDKPRVGDFVQIPDKGLHRCCHAWEDGMQTTRGGSFSTGRHGIASYSGGLDPSKLWERFVDTGKTKRGKFWFFSHGSAGAGRGVDVFLDCRIYELRDITMTEAEARAHPTAKNRFDNVLERAERIQRLMQGQL